MNPLELDSIKRDAAALVKWGIDHGYITAAAPSATAYEHYLAEVRHGLRKGRGPRAPNGQPVWREKRRKHSG